MRGRASPSMSRSRSTSTPLEQLRYWQTRRAHEKALRQLESLATSDQERTDNLARHGRPFDDAFRSPSADEFE